MKVLLTRPDGRNQEMMQQLDDRQVAYLVTPLIEIIPTEQAYNSPLKNADIVIFISTNAVKYAQQQPLPDNCLYFAVGRATADELMSIGLPVFCAPNESQDSEGLLSLAQLQPEQVQGKRIVICKGEGGRETLAQVLEERGAIIEEWPVYQRTLPSNVNSEMARCWQAFGIDTIVLTSGEMLTNIIALLPKDLFAWLQACHIIVPSHRVELQAKALGLTHISNANGANTLAVLSALGLLE